MKTWLTVFAILLISIGGIGLIISIGPCHSGHSEIKYRAAYVSVHSSRVGNHTHTYTTYHPASCNKYWICDERCNKIDVHLKHDTADLGITYVDQKCKEK